MGQNDEHSNDDAAAARRAKASAAEDTPSQSGSKKSPPRRQQSQQQSQHRAAAGAPPGSGGAAARSGPAPAETPVDGLSEYVVLLDTVSWLTYDSWGNQEHNRASFGQHVWLTDEEADVKIGLGAVATPEDADQMLAQQRAKPSDAQLSTMSAEQITAYLVQNADESARVHRLETSRPDGGRAPVLEATGFDELD